MEVFGIGKTEFEVFAQKNSNVFSRRPVSGRIYETLLRKFISIPMVTLCYMTWA